MQIYGSECAVSRQNFTQSISIDVILYARFSKASMRTTLVDGRFLLLNLAVLAICSSCGV